MPSRISRSLAGEREHRLLGRGQGRPSPAPTARSCTSRAARGTGCRTRPEGRPAGARSAIGPCERCQTSERSRSSCASTPPARSLMQPPPRGEAAAEQQRRVRQQVVTPAPGRVGREPTHRRQNAILRSHERGFCRADRPRRAPAPRRDPHRPRPSAHGRHRPRARVLRRRARVRRHHRAARHPRLGHDRRRAVPERRRLSPPPRVQHLEVRGRRRRSPTASAACTTSRSCSRPARTSPTSSGG